MNIVGAASICASPKPPMLCEGLVPSQGIYLVAGAPGVGKTWFSLECGIALTSGAKGFGRFKAEYAKTLYIGEDSPAWDVGAMVGKLLRGHDLTADQVPGFLFGVHQGFHLNEASGLQTMADVIERYLCEVWQDEESHELNTDQPRGLVIIDNLRKIHSKRESNSDDMVLVMDRLRLLAKYVCIMVLHHPSKPVEFEREEWAEVRGSGEITGGSDAVMFLKKRQDIVTARVVRARAAMPVDFKYRMLDEGDEVRMEWCEDEDEYTEVVRSACLQKETIERKDIYQLLEERGYKGAKEAMTRKASRMLQVLVADGVIRKVGYNRYKCLKNNVVTE